MTHETAIDHGTREWNSFARRGTSILLDIPRYSEGGFISSVESYVRGTLRTVHDPFKIAVN